MATDLPALAERAGTPGPTRNAHRAVQAGRITRQAADAWLSGPFPATFVLFRVTVGHPR